MISASAPGKIILFGEHAVVYGRPAIAVPVTEVQAQVTLSPDADELLIHALDQGRSYRLADLDDSHPLAAIIRLILAEWRIATPPRVSLTIVSTIPIAGGLGSGAAVSTAIVRALAAHFGRNIDNSAVSNLVYQVERIHHGTPSGIDNTVIAYAQPVYFVRDRRLEPFAVPRPFRLLIGDTGIASPTKLAVGDVRHAWQADPARFERLFDACGQIADRARTLIESGRPELLGPLMTENHALLGDMSVSSPELDTLVSAACRAGALGAKLSGGGRGGNMIALVTAESDLAIRAALQEAGARRILATRVGANPAPGLPQPPSMPL